MFLAFIHKLSGGLVATAQSLGIVMGGFPDDKPSGQIEVMYSGICQLPGLLFLVHHRIIQAFKSRKFGSSK